MIDAENFPQLPFASGDHAERAGDYRLVLDQLLQEFMVDGQVGSLRTDLLATNPRRDGGNSILFDGFDVSAFDSRHRDIETVLGVNDSVEIEAGFNGGDRTHISSLHKGVFATTSVAALLPCYDDISYSSTFFLLRRYFVFQHV
jgi:hypothetical protein